MTVIFPDIPEAISWGTTREDARSMGADALLTVIDVYFEEWRAVSPPSAPKRGQMMIDLPLLLSAKVYLLNELVSRGMTSFQLARLLRVQPKEAASYLDPAAPTPVDSIARALAALGRRLEIRLGERTDGRGRRRARR